MKPRSTSRPCLNGSQSRKKWKRRLLAYRQDFLQPRVRTAVESHLACCDECLKLLNEVTHFLNQLDVTMALLVSKAPIGDLEMEARRLEIRRRLNRSGN